ncbi:MAG: adenosylhomocysteinase [Candidatus Aenigmarchaeota archaeon]|nr:adenosylhomocysteinase [Candidatus Aenigmarchaeota archaeon]
MSSIKNMSLAEEGKKKIAWAESRMPVLMKIQADFQKTLPFKGIRIGACLHVTKETAVLMKTLKTGGAAVALCGSNPLSTQDDVAAALAAQGIEVFASHGIDNEGYYRNLNAVLDTKPGITMDDGADLITEIHSKRKELLGVVKGGTEETTTGVIRFRAMQKEGKLKFPVIAVNDARCKNMFDNYYGTGQSALDGIIRSTNILLAGKTLVVAGYGHCGSGVAAMAKGMGAHVIVTEVDPVKALAAYYDGHGVMSMDDASALGDVFVTVTGCKAVIVERHLRAMRDGAIISNAGHFDVEIDVKRLKEIASARTLKAGLDEFVIDGKRIYLLGEGRLVNLACAEGHPSEVMDQSFSLQALAAKYINENKLEAGVHRIPKDVDDMVAAMKLEALRVKIDALTPEQERYLSSWNEGT